MTRIVIVSVFVFLCLNVNIGALGYKEKTEYPERPITIYVPYAKNGGTDFIARALGRAMEKNLGQPVVVVNKLGGSGAAGLIAGAAAVPDGYTLTMLSRELVSLPAMGLAEISKDDFRLLCLVNREPAVLVVSEESRFMNLDEIIAVAGQAPGKVRFASAAKPHFYILEFEAITGISFSKIPYNGAAEAIPALVNGDADFTLANPGELKSWLASKQVRAIATMSEERHPALPDTETFGEHGYDISTYTWRGLAIPVSTPDSVFNILETAIAEAYKDSDFLQAMEDANYSPYYLNSVDFAEFIESDIEVITSILKKLPDK